MVDDGLKALVAHDMAVARGAADAVSRRLEADDAAIGALLDRHIVVVWTPREDKSSDDEFLPARVTTAFRTPRLFVLAIVRQ